jgi:hypothetical protein
MTDKETRPTVSDNYECSLSGFGCISPDNRSVFHREGLEETRANLAAADEHGTIPNFVDNQTVSPEYRGPVRVAAINYTNQASSWGLVALDWEQYTLLGRPEVLSVTRTIRNVQGERQ